jgi:TolA-binding protein
MNEFNTQKEARTRLSEGDRSQSDQDLTTLKDKVEDEIATLQSEIDELRRGQELYSVQTQKKKDLEDQKRLISEELGLLVNLALV